MAEQLYVTFKVDRVWPRKKLLPEQNIQYIICDSLGDHVTTLQTNKGTMIGSGNNAFITAMHASYQHHYPLTISPDHIWLLICQGFARHLTVYGEMLQDEIVDFHGKKFLNIVRPDFRRGSSKNNWESAFEDFSAHIRKHIGDELHNVLTPTFSTTTAIEKAAFEISMMSALEPFFDYGMTLCGIPSINLEGTTDDWRKIKKNIHLLRAYDLRWWTDKLEPILDEFIQASEDNANRDFWKTIYKLENASGGPYITGWILKFFPYIGDPTNPQRNPYVERDHIPNRWIEGLTLATIPSGFSYANIKCDDGLNQWDVSFISGFFAVSQNSDDGSLRPEIGWAVRDETAIIESRIEKRLRLREMKQVWQPQSVRVEKQQFTVQFKDGEFFLSNHTLWENDGKLSKLVNRKQVDFNAWEKREYQNLVYTYDPEKISNELAMSLIQSHESKVTKCEKSGSLPI